MANNTRGTHDTFAVFAESDGYDKPLIMMGLTFARLMDDIIVPYESKQPFFIDGAPVTREKIRKLKILRQSVRTRDLAYDFHHSLRSADISRQKMLGEQYYIRLEAILRESAEDVTSQIIRAYDTAIRPQLKDYLPKREELITMAMQVFIEGVKLLGSSHP